MMLHRLLFCLELTFGFYLTVVPISHYCTLSIFLFAPKCMMDVSDSHLSPMDTDISADVKKVNLLFINIACIMIYQKDVSINSDIPNIK